MMFRIRTRWPGGFTLVELTVAISVFGLFALTALASLQMTLEHWRSVSVRVDATSACRRVVSALGDELRQAVPNSAPGPSGYLGLVPAVDPTAVLTPNANLRLATNEVVFTQPDPASYNPLSASFDPVDPGNYRKVRYYVRDGEVRRQVWTLSGSGAASLQADALLVGVDAARIDVAFLEPDLFSLAVSCTRGRNVAQLETRVFVLGR